MNGAQARAGRASPRGVAVRGTIAATMPRAGCRLGSPSRCLAIAFGLAACGAQREPTPRDEVPPSATTDDPALAGPDPEPGPEAVRAAHAAALRHLALRAADAFAAFDPVAAHAIGRMELRPPPASLARVGEVRDALARARREAQGLRVELLEAEPAMLLRTIEVGLERVDEALSGRGAARTDPTVYLADFAEWLDELELAAMVLEPAQAQAAAEELDAAIAQLGGASEAGLDAALHDAEVLAQRVADDPALEPVAQALARARTRLQERKAQPGPAVAWGTVLTPVTGAALPRLPDRWDAATWTRALEREQGVHAEPARLLADVVATLGRLQAMIDRTPAGTTSPARAVTRERCAARWERLAEHAAASEALSHASLSCDAFVARHPEPLDDEDLSIALAHDGIVVPTRRARRREVDASLALVGSRATARAHAHALTISILTTAGETAAAHRMLTVARDDVCRAGTAVWVHTASGPDDALAAQLGAACDHRKPRAWIAEVVARPRAAWAGLGLALLGASPADALALHRFWWVPLGLVIPLAQPPPPVEGTPAPLTIEEFGPAP
jgi:hypothetical protein